MSSKIYQRSVFESFDIIQSTVTPVGHKRNPSSERIAEGCVLIINIKSVEIKLVVIIILALIKIEIADGVFGI